MSAGDKDLAALLLSERDRRDQVLTQALLERRADPETSQAREAADRLLRRHAPWALDLTGAVTSVVEAAGDDRSRRLFLAYSLRTDGRSQGDLAAEEGVSAQRVGKIVQAAGRRVRDAAASGPAPLSWALRTLRDRLGTLAAEEAAAALLLTLGASGQPASDLLLWLAGPFRPVPRRPGWLAVDPGLAVQATTRSLADDGGVRRLSDVESELADAGIRSCQLEAWLNASGAAVVHGLTVCVEGSLSDAAERLLDAYGTPCSADQVAADLAAGGRLVGQKSLAAALRQRRFVRTARGNVGLAAWGPADERRSNKSRSRGGRPSRRAPMGGSEGRHTSTDRPASSTERLWLWIKVDDEALRGSEADVPVALVEALGLEPPTRRTFSSRWGPVVLAHDGTRPTRGSVRAVALATGARRDDTLLLGFSDNGDVAVEVRPASAPAASLSEAETGPVFWEEIASGGTP